MYGNNVVVLFSYFVMVIKGDDVAVLFRPCIAVLLVILYGVFVILFSHY